MGFWSKVFQGAKYSRKQSVPGCKVCYGVKSTEEQSVPGSKMCWVAKGSKKQKGSEWQRVFRSKVCWRVNCDFAKCYGLQSVLCFWEAKCSRRLKCVLVQSVHQPMFIQLRYHLPYIQLLDESIINLLLTILHVRHWIYTLGIYALKLFCSLSTSFLDTSIQFGNFIGKWKFHWIFLWIRRGASW